MSIWSLVVRVLKILFKNGIVQSHPLTCNFTRSMELSNKLHLASLLFINEGWSIVTSNLQIVSRISMHLTNSHPVLDEPESLEGYRFRHINSRNILKSRCHKIWTRNRGILCSRNPPIRTRPTRIHQQSGHLGSRLYTIRVDHRGKGFSNGLSCDAILTQSETWTKCSSIP
jgi:hypothetical protein